MGVASAKEANATRRPFAVYIAAIPASASETANAKLALTMPLKQCHLALEMAQHPIDAFV
jgi:hypothetical protein